MTAAKAFSSFGKPESPFRFVYVSGEGADQSEKGYQLFSRIKGRTEKDLHALETPQFQTLSIRPGGILPTPEHADRMTGWMKYAARYGFPIFSALAPSHVIKASELGEVSVGLANGKGWEKRTDQGWIANPALKEFAKVWT